MNKILWAFMIESLEMGKKRLKIEENFTYICTHTE